MSKKRFYPRSWTAMAVLFAMLVQPILLAACGKSGGVTTATGSTSVPATTNTPGQTVPPTGDPTTPVEAHDNLSRIAAAEGMVLLVNRDGSLPLKTGATVSVFGSGQIDTVKGGTGSGDVSHAETVNFLTGMEEKAAEGKIVLNDTLVTRYKRNKGTSVSKSLTESAAKSSDNAVYIITRNAGEGFDRSSGRGDYQLSDGEVNDIRTIIAAGFKNVTVVLNVGGAVDTTELLAFPEIRSILLAWQPGQEGGRAIADILVGDVTPSGKLTDTLAKSYNDYPTSATFAESKDFVKYTEDIFVGYRWFETFDPNYKKVNFEFGFGLSYTTFDIGTPTFIVKDGKIEATVKVTNTGDTYRGKEVVQLYYSTPQGKLGKPAKELGAFAKTDTLAPGESQTLTLTLSASDMASYDDTGKVQKSAWVLEAGEYDLYLGNSVRNAKENGVRYTYTVDELTVVEQLTEQMVAKLLEERLLADGSYENIYDDSGIGIPLTKALTRVEAESFYVKHEHAELRFNSDASMCGLKMLTSDAGNRYVIFAFDVAEEGDYRVGLGIGNSGGALQNAVKFYVDNVIQPDVLPLPATRGEFNISKVGTATVHFHKGLNFLKVLFVCGDSFTGVLDYITVEYGNGSVETPDPGSSATVKASGVTTVQGEDYIDCSSDVGVEEISAGADKGGVSVKNLHAAGYYVTYNLSVETAGIYRISMRVANGLGDSSNPASCSVNGVRQPDFGYTMPNTSSDGNQYFNFITVSAGTVTLAKGVNQLTFTVNERMGNLNWFTLERVTASASSAAENGKPDSAKSGEKILWADVCKNPTLMDAFIAQLTDEQLAYLLHGHGENIPDGTGSIGGLAEYGIPSAETADGPAGLRLATKTTAWPIETLLACTWNTDLLTAIGRQVGKEAIANNVDLWLAPGMNIHRNPLCGRNFEYYSEDPFITGMMAAALTEGVQSKGVGVTIKHFIGNNKETNRGHSDSRASERALREIYLKGFEICIKKANPWAVMTSYNKVNGKETAETSALLRTILREEWGYNGLVMTDWWNDSIEYRELIAGNNLKMKSGDEAGVLGALKAGIITRELLEENVKTVLEFVRKSRASERVSESAAIEIGDGAVIRSIDASWKSGEIGMEACEDVGGGFNTTNTYEGQWLIFVIDVKEAGTYKVNVRVASETGSGGINFLVDDGRGASFRNTVKTGSWQKWANSNGSVTLTLTEGVHTLRLNFTQGGFNINTLTFTLKK